MLSVTVVVLVEDAPVLDVVQVRAPRSPRKFGGPPRPHNQSVHFLASVAPAAVRSVVSHDPLLHAPVTRPGHFSRLFPAFFWAWHRILSSKQQKALGSPATNNTRNLLCVRAPRSSRLETHRSTGRDRRGEERPARERRGQWKGITRSSEPRRRPPTRPSEAISAGDSVSRHLTASGAPAAPHASRRRWRGCPTLGGEPV